jgi:hypothetical protein
MVGLVLTQLRMWHALLSSVALLVLENVLIQILNLCHVFQDDGIPNNLHEAIRSGPLRYSGPHDSWPPVPPAWLASGRVTPRDIGRQQPHAIQKDTFSKTARNCDEVAAKVKAAADEKVAVKDANTTLMFRYGSYRLF